MSEWFLSSVNWIFDCFGYLGVRNPPKVYMEKFTQPRLMKDITKFLGVFLIITSMIAYWDGISNALSDIKIGVLELSSLFNMEPLQVVFFVGGIAFFAYLAISN